MKIDRVTRYRVNGREFETLGKAQDYVDGEINKILTNALTLKGLGVRESVRLTETVLENRDTLARLLSCSGPDAEEWNEN